MRNFLIWILIFGMAAYVLKLAIIVAIVIFIGAGLILRPRQTIGILLFLSGFVLIEKFPIACLFGFLLSLMTLVGWVTVGRFRSRRA